MTVVPGISTFRFFAPCSHGVRHGRKCEPSHLRLVASTTPAGVNVALLGFSRYCEWEEKHGLRMAPEYVLQTQHK